jgi:hypothetical protein
MPKSRDQIDANSGRLRVLVDLESTRRPPEGLYRVGGDSDGQDCLDLVLIVLRACTTTASRARALNGRVVFVLVVRDANGRLAAKHGRRQPFRDRGRRGRGRHGVIMVDEHGGR